MHPIKKSGTANREKNDAYYTKQTVIDMALLKAQELLFFDSIDCVIDTSAGDNRFINSLKAIFPNKNTLAFDINPQADGIIKKDWLTVEKQDLPEGNLCIGFNPPFGLCSSKIKEFISHSFKIGNIVKIILIHPTIDIEYITPINCNVIYTKKLDKNSFERLQDKSCYNTNASMTFFVAQQRINECNFKTRPSNVSGQVEWCSYTRYGGLVTSNSLIVRRTGVNFLRQAYIFDNKKPLFYIENGKSIAIAPNQDIIHKLESDAFYKFDVTDENVDLLKTAKALTIVDRMETDLLKTPPSTTNHFMNKILRENVVYKQ